MLEDVASILASSRRFQRGNFHVERGGKIAGWSTGNEVPHVIWLMMRFKSDGVFVLVFVFAHSN